MLGLIVAIALLAPQQQPTTTQTVALVFKDRVETVEEIRARAELMVLANKPVMRKVDHERFSALVNALGTTTEPAKCITWDQHVAEVSSWWSAPERVYVPCDDPRVGPPEARGNQ